MAGTAPHAFGDRFVEMHWRGGNSVVLPAREIFSDLSLLPIGDPNVSLAVVASEGPRLHPTALHAAQAYGVLRR